jgi:hypothetical protein
MVPASLSAREERVGDWVCLECEETGELWPNTWQRAAAKRVLWEG